MLPGYFDYIFVHLKQKVRLRPELSPKFLSTLGPNPTRKARAYLQLWLEDNFFGLLVLPSRRSGGSTLGFLIFINVIFEE